MKSESGITFPFQSQFFFTARVRLEDVVKVTVANFIIFVAPTPVLEDELAILGIIDWFTISIVRSQACRNKEALRRIEFVLLCDLVVKHGAKYIDVI